MAVGLLIKNLDVLLKVWTKYRRANAATADPSAIRRKLEADQPALAAFLDELQASLAGQAAEAAEKAPLPAGVVPASKGETGAGTAMSVLQEFVAFAPKQLAILRTIFSEISRRPRDAASMNQLLEFSRRLGPLLKQSQLPELLPVWLLASALEGLARQASSNQSHFTSSVQHTLAAALDLLEVICVQRLPPALVSRPLIRILAVDDDAICRRAITLALRKTFAQPDLAPGGGPGLVLAEKQTYDVIFLDVDMPDMNGFELCAKIRQTALNRTTPVVFVTRHGDFNSRAKSTLSGGQDLIAKPYLPSEITVKALTLVLRARLDHFAAAPAEREKVAPRKVGAQLANAA